MGAAIAALLAVIVSKFTSHQRVLSAEAPEETESRKEILDRIITLVGGIFAFILGLVIVTNLQVMTTARQTTIDEVNGLSQIYSAAHALPEPQHALIRNSIRTYVNTVIHVEWPLMSRHKMGEQAQAEIDNLRNEVQNWDISTPRLATMQGQALAGITATYSARRTRGLEAEEGLPTFMWGLLIGDGLVMLCVPLLRGVKFTKTEHGSVHHVRRDDRALTVVRLRAQLPVQRRTDRETRRLHAIPAAGRTSRSVGGTARSGAG
jgi:hypothetical protein